MSSDQPGTERTWSSVLCLIAGHAWVGHTAYKLQNDSGRALYGDLCERCGKFQPRADGKQWFEAEADRETRF